MKSSWVKGLDTDQKTEFTALYKESRVVRNKAIELLHEKLECSRKESITKESYDCPNWSFKQADTVGYQRGLIEIINLLSDK